MQPDDDSQTTLSKWPFIIGDVLLVATALAIAIFRHWQLTDWQAGACVAAVALGAALFVLPYVVEYQFRIREEREDRPADLRILEKHLLAAEQAIDAAAARIRVLENATAETDDSNAALAEAMDQKIAQQEAARAAQEEVIQTLQKNLQELAAKELPLAFDPGVLKPIEKRLKALEAKPAPEPTKPEPKAEVSKPEQKTPEPPEPEQTVAPEPEKKSAPIERPQREARERHGPQESRLLKRAISEKGDKSSTAVSRIIESKSKEKTPEAPKEPEKTKPEPERKELVKKEKPKEEEPNSEKPEPEPEPKQDRKAAAAPPESAKQEKPTSVPTEEPTEEASAPVVSEMLFDEDKITSPIIRTKAKKNDAVVTASVFIGIGNKPYLRGSGAGLSWEKGQLMEFQEIGKWRWVAPSDLEAPLELQIYRNDEDPDQSGKFTLEPGQKLGVTPVF